MLDSALRVIGVAGVNLPMLLRVVCHPNKTMPELAKTTLNKWWWEQKKEENERIGRETRKAFVMAQIQPIEINALRFHETHADVAEVIVIGGCNRQVEACHEITFRF